MRTIDHTERPDSELGTLRAKVRGRLILKLTLASSLLCALQGCTGGSGAPRPALSELSVTENQTGINFSLQKVGQTLFLVYPDLDLLSLNLVTAGLPTGESASCTPQLERTTFLDRISDTPEIDVNFGKHWFSSKPKTQTVFYLDCENEGTRVLKWLSKGATDEQWWIDVLPFRGTPLGGWTNAEGAFTLVFTHDQSLYLRDISAAGDPTAVSASFVPSGTVSVIQSRDFRALTVYDARSRCLYLLRAAGGGVSLEPVYAGAEVHYATIEAGQLLILVYDPAEASVVLLEKTLDSSASGPSGEFDVIPITLSEGTTSVFVTVFEGWRYFLFNELASDNNKTTHRLSLLYPEMTRKGLRYKKSVLTESASPLQRFAALASGSCLYIACLQDSLKLISFSLSETTGNN